MSASSESPSLIRNDRAAAGRIAESPSPSPLGSPVAPDSAQRYAARQRVRNSPGGSQRSQQSSLQASLSQQFTPTPSAGQHGSGHSSLQASLSQQFTPTPSAGQHGSGHSASFRGTASGSVFGSLHSSQLTSSPASPLHALPFERDTSVVEFVNVTDLAAIVPALTGFNSKGVSKASVAQKLLSKVYDIVPAESWLAKHFPGQQLPPELVGKKVGSLDVKYESPPKMDNQRRFALHLCVFGLSRTARDAATNGLYYDGDIEASELRAFEEACSRCALPCSQLTEFLNNRPARLAELGTMHDSLSGLSPKEQRSFAKQVRCSAARPPEPQH